MGTLLLNEVKVYFNSNDERAFYQASGNYRDYYETAEGVAVGCWQKANS